MSAGPGSRDDFVARLLRSRTRENGERLARRCRDLADDEAARLLDAHFNAVVWKSPKTAEAAARAAAVVAAVARTPFARAIAHRLAGQRHHVLGHPGRARPRLRSAVETFERAGEILRAGDECGVLIDVEIESGRPAEALRWAKRAERLYERAGGADPARLGHLAMNVANVEHDRDRHAQALEGHGEARRHFERAGNRRLVASAEYNEANVLASLDRTSEARVRYERAREVFEEEGLAALELFAEYALADLDALEGRLDPALERFDAVREAKAAMKDRAGVAHADLDAAAVLLRLNRPNEADERARRARRHFRRTGHAGEAARAEAIRGAAALQRQDLGQAMRRLRRAASAQREAGNVVAAAKAEVGLAAALVKRGGHDEAEEIAREAAAVFRRAAMPSARGRALVVAADAALAGGRHAAARTAARAALSAVGDGLDRHVALGANLVLAREAARRGRAEAEHEALQAAADCVEALRPGVTSETSRLTFAIDKVEVYEALVRNRLDVGTPEAAREALAHAERGKARALAERLASRVRPRARSIAAADPGDPGLERARARLAEIDRLIAVAEARLEEPGGPPGVRRAVPGRLSELLSRRQGLVAELGRRDPLAADELGVTPAIDDVIAALDGDDLTLELFEAEGHYHLFVIERGGVEAIPRVAASAELVDLVDLLRFHLGKEVLRAAGAEGCGPLADVAIERHLSRLHDLLLGAVSDRLDGRRLRIVPHGALHALPFQALLHGGRALIERATSLSLAPSLAVLALLRARERGAGGAPLVLGVSDAAAPAIEAEVSAIRRLLSGARVLRGADATRKELETAGARPSLVHVACHGVYADAAGVAGGGCGLRLGDAWVSLSDIHALRGTGDIVVLSGCETGRGSVHAGDEWVGLVRAFLQAGASAVVASSWEVHDESTAKLMSDFYSSLTNGSTVSEALAEAQRAARRAGVPVACWAPFTVVGDATTRLGVRRAA